MDKNMTMLQLFQKFSEATQNINSLKFIIGTMKRTPELESVTYTASDDQIVLDETYVVQSAGKYVIKSEGSGKASYVVKGSNQSEVVYEGKLNDTAESESLYLTAGDVIHFHASADNDATESVILQQITTFFDMMSRELEDCVKSYDYINSRIDVLISGRMEAEMELNREINLLISRMNTFTSLSEGSTTGDAELIDARIGYTGVGYDSVGDAIRNQVRFLDEKLEELNINKVPMPQNSVGGIDYGKQNQVAQSDGEGGIIWADISKNFHSVEFDKELRYLRFLDEDGEDVYDPVYIEGGGSGGGSAQTSDVKLVNNTGYSSTNLPYGETVELQFTFTSLDGDQPTGDGVCQITVNGVSQAKFNVNQGLIITDVTKYLKAGSNTVRVKVTDVYGNYKILTYTISLVELSISSTFDDSVAYTGSIQFKYIPYGAIEKTIHIIVDGNTENEAYTHTTTSAKKQITAYLGELGHGSHTIDAYITATMDGQPIESNHLVYSVVCLESNNTEKVISSVYGYSTVVQGTQVSIPYMVYDPQSLTSAISLVVSTSEGEYSSQDLVVDRTKHYWNVRNYPTGEVFFTIKCGEQEKTHKIVVEEANIGVEAVTNDLELYLSSFGRSNSELYPDVWEYGEVSTSFHNVNWDSTGWVADSNGDTVLRLNGGATAEIGFKPFETDFKGAGKTIEIEFAVRDINNRDAVIISCMYDNIGFSLTADTATLFSEQSSIFCNYHEEEKVRVSFVVESKSEYRLLQVYLNGILSGTKQYPSTDNFQQSVPMNITIGSSYCGVDIYTIRSYSNALTFGEIVNNYTADMPDIVEKTLFYEANDLYDEYGNLSYEAVKDKIPVMTIIGELPQSKGDKKDVTVKFEHNTNSDLSFEDTGTIDVQGTSSQWYIRKNYKEKLDKEHLHAVGQMPTRVFCTKADYAESTGTHNTQNANLVETLYSEKTPAQLADPRCRTTIYGYPIVIFHQATESSTPEFIGKYNFNFDKGSEEVFGFNDNFDVECWEFCNNTSDACNFKGTIPANWKDDFEPRYLAEFETEDGLKISFDRIEKLQEKTSLTPEEEAELLTQRTEAIKRFKVMHDWVLSTQGNPQKFKEEFEDYFDLHFTLIYYVYTFVMLMVDQRAKNMFLTYWADTGKWQPWFYDNDTCLGINNEGKLVFDYYHEDTDVVGDSNVYNGQNSTLWTNFREVYADEIQKTYQDLRSSGKLTYDKVVEYFLVNGASKWPANVYNEDSDYKYISMLRSSNDATNLYQIRGDGAGHLKYFVENRLNYCDSKWYATDYADNFVTLRIYTPAEYGEVEPNANITIVPFSNMYAGVRYKANGTLQQIKVTKNQEVTFEAPNEIFNDTETAIYGATEISSLGDLAPLYCGTVNVSKASRLVNLKIGDEAEGYRNTNLTELSVGTNRLLRTIDIRNCPNLTEPLDLSGCPNIRSIYATGSGITGIELPESGYLSVVHLPDTITNLTMKNQLYVTDFVLNDCSNITTLCIENCPALDDYDIFNKATNLKRVRLVGVDWTFEDDTYLVKLINNGLYGIDENGYNTPDVIQIIGKCHINKISSYGLAKLVEKCPYLELSYDDVKSYAREIVTRNIEGYYRNEKVTEIGSYGLAYCNDLTAVCMPNVINLGNYALYSCNLEIVDMPKLQRIGFFALARNPIKSIDMSNVEFISMNAFDGCTKLTFINAPKLETINTYTFQGCNSLKTAILPIAKSIKESFKGCDSLDTLVLGSSSLCSLETTTAFSSTPIANGTGYIYVPSALIEEYKVATNWSVYANQFRAIEDYPEICNPETAE